MTKNFKLWQCYFPIIADRLVEAEFGTGAVKVTPAHSVVDNKISKDHKLEVINVIGEDGKMTKEAGNYAGLDVLEARKKMGKKLGRRDTYSKNRKNKVLILRQEGKSIKEISRMTGISKSRVHQLVKEKAEKQTEPSENELKAA